MFIQCGTRNSDGVSVCAEQTCPEHLVWNAQSETCVEGTGIVMDLSPGTNFRCIYCFYRCININLSGLTAQWLLLSFSLQMPGFRVPETTHVLCLGRTPRCSHTPTSMSSFSAQQVVVASKWCALRIRPSEFSFRSASTTDVRSTAVAQRSWHLLNIVTCGNFIFKFWCFETNNYCSTIHEHRSITVMLSKKFYV